MMPNLNDGAHLLPPNATELEIAAAEALARISDIGVPLADLWRPDTAPVEALPFLAWAVRVDVWNAAWPEATKRAVIKAAVETHRRRGTIGAVRRALAALGSGVKIAEWFETGGAPHTFHATVAVNDILDDGVVLSARRVADIIKAIEATKPARSHFDFTILAGFADEIAFAGALSAGSTAVAVGPAAIEDPAAEAALSVAGGLSLATVLAIGGEAAIAPPAFLVNPMLAGGVVAASSAIFHMEAA